MYVVKYKERVVLGIIPWNDRYITDVMKTRYRIDIELPYLEPENTEFPYKVNDDIIIYPASENRDENINPMVQYYYGPTWQFLEDKAIAHYEIVPLNLNDAKNNYISRAANMRYDRETSGTLIKLNDVDYKLETDRTSRSKFIEKYINLSDGQNINWKFSNDWISLNKKDIENIIQAINNHVQSAFDWEFNMNNTINSATSLEDLLAIEELNSAQNIN